MIASPLDAYRFPANSRYADCPLLTLTLPDGREVRYLERRLLPDPAGFTVVKRRAIADGDRLDAISAAEISDPELWWRIADANAAMNPPDLLQPLGRRLAIPMPLGMPGGGGV
ncbi:hypothetical protein [Novosphingobium sp. 9U]|uniref:hypothetical protein n=1 Tax=Novosphingobium sp. 9U TaxID=2653158 RepID=UPI0012EEED8F|nr:hypothetical protein [Novosphingobium sp. 9U]VWX50900.1 LysM domain-containing protein [Novosphingobium sp. 9U]